MITFSGRLERCWSEGARVCVGLDIDCKRLPQRLSGEPGTLAGRMFERGKKVIQATRHTALCYKLNYAFYNGNDEGRHRADMQEVLDDLFNYIRVNAPYVATILDAKRADIGNTNNGYVCEAFGAFKADAVTVNPYFGMEAMRPFLDKKEKGVIVLCRTSNPGAEEFQDRGVLTTPEERAAWDISSETIPFYKLVAYQVSRYWNYNNNCALVVGATAPKQLASVRKIVGDDMWLLLPGFGAQGASVADAVRAGAGKHMRIIPGSSSGIIYSDNPGHEIEKLTKEINEALMALA